MKVFFNRLPFYVTCLAMIAIVSACGSAPKPMTVVVFSAGDPAKAITLLGTAENTKQPSLSQTPTPQDIAKGTPLPNLSLAAEQKRGYQYAESEVTPIGQAQQYADLILTYQLENNPQQEIASVVREEVIGKDKSVIALLGATSNESSVRLAALSNAFNVPMIIPSSVGDNLLPSSNLWVFRLSAPGSSHGQYFFNDVLTRSLVDTFKNDGTPSGSPTPTPTLTPSPTPSPTATPTAASTSSTPTSPTQSPTLPSAPTQVPFKIAILYEQNTFGESSAVAAAREAMKQGMIIGFYGSFDPSNPDATTLKKKVNEEVRGAQLVYLIASQPNTAQIVVKSIRDELKDQMPVLLGQSGAFSSREFLDSPEADGMFVLRQKIVADCLPQKTSLTEAQSYAAVALLHLASENARDKVGNLYASQTISQKREGVRDELKLFNRDLKCLGRVSFDNAGQNKNLAFEILQITATGSIVVDIKTFQETLKAIYVSTNIITESSPFDFGP